MGFLFDSPSPPPPPPPAPEPPEPIIIEAPAPIPEPPKPTILDTPIGFKTDADSLGKIKPSEDKKKKLKVMKQGLNQLKIPLDNSVNGGGNTTINV